MSQFSPEPCLLGCCLIDQSAAKLAASSLIPGQFYHDRDRELFTSIRNVVQRGDPVDRVAVYRDLIARRVESKVEAGYLLELEGIPTAANAKTYISQVKADAMRRDGVNLCNRGATALQDPANKPDDILLGITEQVRELIGSNGNGHMADGRDWAEVLKSAEIRRGKNLAVPGVSLFGGIVPGDLVVVAGRPGMGKSTWACQVSVQACLYDKLPTLIVSTEMTKADWGQWMAAIVAERTIQSLPKPLPKAILEYWQSAPIHIADRGTVSIHDIRAMADQIDGLRLVIVDHVGRVAGGRRESRTLEVGDVARGLKSLAKDLHCTVIALCQLNRRVEGDETKRPRLSDLRESGELEQEADAVLFLWTQEKDISQAELPMNMTLSKHRHGPLGHIGVIFNKGLRRFTA